jgi:hypothetical protein
MGSLGCVNRTATVGAILSGLFCLVGTECLPPIGGDPGGDNGQETPAWVQDLITQFESQPVANPPLSLWRYQYQGRTVYYVPSRCCDIWSDLYDADGSIICHPDGGITGLGDGQCPDFFTGRTDGVLIWEDPRQV